VAPKAAVHHPGPCTILGRDGGGSLPLNTQRTQRAYDAGALNSELHEEWYGTIYDRNSTAWSLARDGRRLRSVWRDQYVYADDPTGGGHSSVGFTDFSYDGEELLTATTSTSSFQWAGQSPSPLQVARLDSYFVDALGREFLAKVVVPERGEILHATLTLFPSGAVSGQSITQLSAGGGLPTERYFYDEHGAVLLHDFSGTDRSSVPVPYYVSEEYHYDGGHIASVDSDMLSPSGPPAGHTTYRYDASGNNVERTTTDRAGNVVARWIGVHDAASNLVCEQQTGNDLFHHFVRHYDYGCF
jgi:hypothetical protein